jgi:hypothetical protein
MPTKKVRRRRAKLKRHEYEYVVETPEGEEVPVERPEKKERAEAPRRDRELLDRRGRPVPQPSLRRVGRRTAIFAPIIFAFLYITQSDQLTVAGLIFNTVLLLAFFAPFSYLVDVFVHRALKRRLERERTGGR